MRMRWQIFAVVAYSLSAVDPTDAQDDITRYFEVSYEDIKIATDIEGSIDDGFIARSTMTEDGKTVLSTEFPDLYSPSQFPEFSFVEMDGDLSRPEVYITQWTGGAHCCSAVSVLVKLNGNWKVIDAGAYDGEPKIPADIDGDRKAELVAYDNAFLYRFSSYAGSFAPIEIVGLRDGDIRTVTAEPRYRSIVESSLEDMGSIPERGPERNSWLAAYAATKLVLGDISVFEFVEENFDREAEWGLQDCLVKMTNGECPEGKQVTIPFPYMLKSFLIDTGYLGVKS